MSRLEYGIGTNVTSGRPVETTVHPVSNEPDGGKHFVVMRDRTEPKFGGIRPGNYTVLAFREPETSGPIMTDTFAWTAKGALRKALRREGTK